MVKKQPTENKEEKTVHRSHTKEDNTNSVESSAITKEVIHTECNDKFCPFHGSTKIHGRTLKGIVVSAKAHKTITIDKLRLFYITKYERYEKRHTKLIVHNPPCINAKLGEVVRVVETRPLSKTKHFVVVEVLSKK